MKIDQFQELLAETLTEFNDSEQLGIDDIYTFEEMGLLTENNGLVLKMEDGSEFQMTIVKSA
jgi:hypothetical protein